MRKLLLIIFTTLLIAFLPTFVFADNIKINIDGVSVPFTDTTGVPFIDNTNHTQVPLRITMESYGCKVSWSQTTKTAVIEKDKIKVEVPIGVNYIFKNGTKIPNDTSALIKDGRIYLPIKSVLNAFGANVLWDQSTHTVVVNSISINKSGKLFYSLFPEIPCLENVTANIDFLFLSKLSNTDTYCYTYEADNWERANLYSLDYVRLLTENNFEKTSSYLNNEVQTKYHYEMVSPDKKYTVAIRTMSFDSKASLLGERDDGLADEIVIWVTLN